MNCYFNSPLTVHVLVEQGFNGFISYRLLLKFRILFIPRVT